MLIEDQAMSEPLLPTSPIEFCNNAPPDIELYKVFEWIDDFVRNTIMPSVGAGLFPEETLLELVRHVNRANKYERGKSPLLGWTKFCDRRFSVGQRFGDFCEHEITLIPTFHGWMIKRGEYRQPSEQVLSHSLAPLPLVCPTLQTTKLFVRACYPRPPNELGFLHWVDV
jgi:hypothetical protein